MNKDEYEPKEEKRRNILKSRDDPHYVAFIEAEQGKFSLDPATQCTWLKPEESFGPDKLRPRIEPWLTALVQSEHLSLLVGSGLTHAVHWLAKKDTFPGMAIIAKFSVFQSQIAEAAIATARAAGRSKANFEDQLRVANELLSGLEHYCLKSDTSKESIKLKKEVEKLRQDISKVINEFIELILKGEKSIVSVEESKREEAFGYLVNFLLSFASRTGTRDRIQIFTTNYDRLLEAGAEVAGLHLLDRFVGNLAPIFRSSRLNIDMHYNPPGIRGEPRYLEGVARFTKLHGSVDWVQAGSDIRRMSIPFGADTVKPYLKAPGLADATPMNLMIYPNSSKDRETAAYPYVELFRDLAAAVCRPNNTLITYGYSFGDEHINRVIEDMLTIPSTHLVIISYDDPMDRIMNTYEKVARPAQMTLLVGTHLGDLKTLVDHYLPKPAIDRITSRMSELLKTRFGTEQAESTEKEEIGGEVENEPKSA